LPRRPFLKAEEDEMGFLLAKMLLLLALAAACGGLFAYWWFRRHYEDVTLDYTRSRDEWSAWRHGLEERLATLEAAVRAIDIPQPQPLDLNPVLAALAPLHKRLTGIEHALFPVQTRLDELEGAVRAARAVPPAPSPAPDLGPVLERLEALRERLDNPRPRKVSVREGSRNLLSHAGLGKPDDLTQIKGVPKVLERALHKVGVFYFWQIAEWSAEDVKYVDRKLASVREGLEGCIDRDSWVSQASPLAEASTAHPPVKHH
jgi:predicted flap endonuclease-1-like 5' DNA nuclease